MVHKILNYIKTEKDEKKTFDLIKEHLLNLIEIESKKDLLQKLRIIKQLEVELELYKEGQQEGLNSKAINFILKLLKIELDLIAIMISCPEIANFFSPNKPKSKLEWTDSKTDLTELIYSIQPSINKGKASIAMITENMEYMFNTKIKNVYDTFNDIINRKNERTRYLNKLVERLNKTLDLADAS